MGKVVLLAGPTATGKTAVACDLQDRLGGVEKVRLISADSALVYRGMDIGTAKPSPAELARYPHALIDILDPSQPYSAADFVRDADIEVQRAWQAGQLPILVGGTMLYLQCFVRGIASLPAADPAVRAMLAAELDERGGAALHAELTEIDPEAAQGIHPNNSQRLLRALEVVRQTGQPLSTHWREQAGVAAQQRLDAQVHTFAIVPTQREILHQRIEQRFDAMVAAGLFNEVATLMARDDLHLDLPAMRAVGYRQVWECLAGNDDRNQCRADVLTATRRLAKRQMTWLRSWPELMTFDLAPPSEIAAQICKMAAL